MAEDKIFADGFIVKRRENAPDFVVANVSIKVDEFGKFVKANAKDGWINLDVKTAQSGKMYAELNTWQPDEKVQKVAQGESDLPW
jgi:hypothetical protein